MTPKLVIGNLKMYIDTRSAWETYVSRLRGVGTVLTPEDRMSFVVCPSALYTMDLVRSCADLPLSVGAQDAGPEATGKHTGEISPVALSEAGVRYVIIGHSERRAAGESLVRVADKVAAALAAGLVPIVCVGYATEGEDEVSAIIESVAHVVRTCDVSDVTRILFAYEPVWAIGSGRTPTGEQIQMISLCIRRAVGKLIPDAPVPRILYGGSVTAENAAALAASSDVDGFLVGGASRDPEELVRIYRTIN